jgi:hypothetical protein
MSKVLITWNSNWADEMDISGFVITNKKEADNLKKKLQDKKDEFEIYVGSNEEISYSNGRELLSELSFKKISDSESEVISNLIGGEYGHTEFFDIDFD